MKEKRLYRSSTNKVLSGVLGGIGEYFDIDPILVRIIYIVLFHVAGGPALLLYMLLTIVIPYDYQVKNNQPYDNFGSRPGPGPRPGGPRSPNQPPRKDVTPPSDEEDNWSDF